MIHNQQTPPIQCHNAVAKEYVTGMTTETIVETQHFPIYQRLKDKLLKLQFNKIYLHASQTEHSTKAQPLNHVQNQRTKQF